MEAVIPSHASGEESRFRDPSLRSGGHSSWFKVPREDKMICCDEMQRAMDYEMMVKTEKYKVRDGRVINDIETEYFTLFFIHKNK